MSAHPLEQLEFSVGTLVIYIIQRFCVSRKIAMEMRGAHVWISSHMVYAVYIIYDVYTVQ